MSKIKVHLVSSTKANHLFVTQTIKSIDPHAQIVEHESIESYLQYIAVDCSSTIVVTDFDKVKFRNRSFIPVIQYTTQQVEVNTALPINAWNSSPVYLSEIDQFLTEAIGSLRLYEKLRSSASRLPTLTERERRVVLLASEGVPNKSIARRLDVSVKTVEKSRRNAYNKLMVNSSAEVASLVTFGRFFADNLTNDVSPINSISPTSHFPTSSPAMHSNSMIS